MLLDTCRWHRRHILRAQVLPSCYKSEAGRERQREGAREGVEAELVQKAWQLKSDEIGFDAVM